MSGPRQHTIPRLFLKEFVIPDGSNQIYKYQRGQPKIIRDSCNNASINKYFHSKRTDDLITKYEAQFLRHLVVKARKISTGNRLCAPLISEIGAHLMIRLPYLRIFSETGIEISFLLQKHLFSLFESLDNLTLKATTYLCYQALREDFDLFYQLVLDNLDSVNQRKFLKDARKIHDEALEKEGMAPADIKAGLEKFQWKVVYFPSGDAILPDCVGIGKTTDGWKPYVLAQIQIVTQVVIPLSSTSLAVGSITDDWEKVTKIYNQIARQCSYDFYLTNREEETSESDLAKIGDPVRAMIANYSIFSLREPPSPFTDPYENKLFKYNDTLLKIYFSTIFTHSDHETMKFHTEQAITHLNQMNSTTTDAYGQYQTDNDHERYFETCAVCVSNFMKVIARYFAVRSTFFDSHHPDVSLENYLKQFKLTKWAKLFEIDLTLFNRRLNNSANLVEMYCINRHFERLLFEIGVLPDQLADGSFFIHIFTRDYHLLPDDQAQFSL